MSTFKIYTDWDEDHNVNRASFDGHFSLSNVRDRTDDYGRALAHGASMAVVTGSVGTFISQGGISVYIERVQEMSYDEFCRMDGEA
jgi:hypothetical protein